MFFALTVQTTIKRFIMNTTSKSTHIGRKISKIRRLRVMKKEALAMDIGVNSQGISNIENSNEVEEKFSLIID